MARPGGREPVGWGDRAMTLSLVRVDDRLIHGQVVTIWLRAIGADRIVIVDDETARDEYLKTVLTLAAPAGVPVEVLNVEAGVPRLGGLAAGPERVLVLLRSPVTALRLREAGAAFDVLNVGGIGSGPGRRSLHRSISASAEELGAMRRLEALGTHVELRVLADDRPVPLSAVDPEAGGEGRAGEGGAEPGGGARGADAGEPGEPGDGGRR